jgi:hypothetical protein
MLLLSARCEGSDVRLRHGKGKFKLGDLVRHKKSNELVFVIEFELLNAEGADSPSLYECSQTMSIGYERHTYHENDLIAAGEVKDIEKPGPFKWPTIILRDLLDMAKNGGMRDKRGAALYEEFIDHWNALDEKDGKETDAIMASMVERISVFAALAKQGNG